MPQKEINFDLFDKDYISVHEVFSMHNQKPFNLESDLVDQIDVKRFQEKPGGASLASKRYAATKTAAGSKGPGGGKTDWGKSKGP